MFNLLALTGRLSRLEKRLEELETKGEGASGEEEAERVDVKERVACIRERMKDWETEVSRAGRAVIVVSLSLSRRSFSPLCGGRAGPGERLSDTRVSPSPPQQSEEHAPAAQLHRIGQSFLLSFLSLSLCGPPSSDGPSPRDNFFARPHPFPALFFSLFVPFVHKLL